MLAGVKPPQIDSIATGFPSKMEDERHFKVFLPSLELPKEEVSVVLYLGASDKHHIQMLYLGNRAMLCALGLWSHTVYRAGEVSR